MIYIIVSILLFALMLGYFRLADRYNIIDHPNERSSHTEITIRGGGVVIVFAALIAAVIYPAYWLPMLGVFIIGGISFLDDRMTLSRRLRLLFHLIAVTLMFLFLNLFHLQPWWACILLYIIAIGIINMYNFMDGINGITGLYSLIILAGLQYVNLYTTPFIEKDIIWLPMLGCLVFLFFNFRKKAKCFAGDVGSIAIAFWITLLLLRLIFISGNWGYILFIVVYGIDSVLTITHRAILKQDIFKPHRFHFYQLLVNEQKVPHLWVASGYALLQTIIICFIIANHTLPTLGLFCIIIIPLCIIYIFFKRKIIHAKHQGPARIQ